MAKRAMDMDQEERALKSQDTMFSSTFYVFLLEIIVQPTG